MHVVAYRALIPNPNCLTNPTPPCALPPRQDTSLSVWRRQPGELTYSALCYHKLTPAPSRLNSNATVNVLSVAASTWRPGLSPSTPGDLPTRLVLRAWRHQVSRM